jgi:hypothetical protein
MFLMNFDFNTSELVMNVINVTNVNSYVSIDGMVVGLDISAFLR